MMESRLRLFIFFLLIAVIGVGAASLFYYGFYVQEHHKINVDFQVREGEVGFNIDTDALHFGHLNPGGRGVRHMIITPVRDARLSICFSGSLASFMSVEENDFPVYAGEPLNISIFAEVPLDAQLGQYNGTAHFYFYRW